MLNFNNQNATINPQIAALLTLLTGANNGLDPFDPIGSIVRNNNPTSNPYGLQPGGFDIVRTDQVPSGPGGYINPYGGNNPYFNPNQALSNIDLGFENQGGNPGMDAKMEIMRMLGIAAPMDPISKFDRGIMYQDRSNFMPQAQQPMNTGRNLGGLTIPSGVTGRNPTMQQQAPMQPIKQPPINYNQGQGNAYQQPYEPYKRF